MPSITKKKPRAKTKGKQCTRLGLGRVAAIVTLVQGGIVDSGVLAAAVGFSAFREGTEFGDFIQAMAKYQQIDSVVRCNDCGGKINVVPCVACSANGRKPSYRA